MAGTLHIARSRGEWVNAIRRFTIIVDGEMRARLRRGESVYVPLESGKHEVRLRLDRSASPSIMVELSDGETQSFLARNGDILGERGNHLALIPLSKSSAVKFDSHGQRASSRAAPWLVAVSVLYLALLYFLPSDPWPWVSSAAYVITAGPLIFFLFNRWRMHKSGSSRTNLGDIE
ncbi:hypothetical protein KEM60_00003 [Austwickia sp. TVS 96-490-7B]|nr:hypothetical protein [Austwickia sp. TVS 96-490-7B]